MNNKTESKPGRRPSFPGVETTKILTNIPVETAEMLRKLSDEKDIPINVLIDRFVRRGFRAASRKS